MAVSTGWITRSYGVGSSDLRWSTGTDWTSYNIDPGNGEASIRYRRDSGIIAFHLYVRIGPTTTLTAGGAPSPWTFQLPSEAFLPPPTSSRCCSTASLFASHAVLSAYRVGTATIEPLTGSLTGYAGLVGYISTAAIGRLAPWDWSTTSVTQMNVLRVSGVVEDFGN